MEGMFRQLGIYSAGRPALQAGGRRPADVLPRGQERPDAGGGHQRGRARCRRWIAAATSYSTNNVPMIPFYIYYSMFGFQRVGDLAWAAGDMRARGFLLGGTAGRTTLNGEGLQHEDGHSHILVVHDPELRLLRPDLRLRARGDRPRRHAPHVCRAGGRLLLHHADERELRAPRRCRRAPRPASSRACTCSGTGRRDGKSKAPRVQLLGSGTILREVIAAAELLAEDCGVAADIWSVTSFTELRRDGIEAERWNLLHPTEPPRRSHVEQCLSGRSGPVVAATDYMRLFADQIRDLGAGRATRARHRRLRPHRLPPQAAPLLRGRPALRHRRGAQGAGRRGRGQAQGGGRGDRRNTGSIREKPNPMTV